MPLNPTGPSGELSSCLPCLRSSSGSYCLGASCIPLQPHILCPSDTGLLAPSPFLAFVCAQSLSQAWLFTTSWDCSPPGSSVLGTLQARILEWVPISSSRGSSRPRDRTCISCIGRWILYHWATWKVPHAFISLAHSMASARIDLPWLSHLVIALFSNVQLRSFVLMKLFLLAHHPQDEHYFWFFMTRCAYVYHSCETSFHDLSFSSLSLPHQLDCRLREGSHVLCIPSAFSQCFMKVCGMNE